MVSQRVRHNWSTFTFTYMSIPVSQFILLPWFPLGNHKFVFYICDYFWFVNRFICTVFILLFWLYLLTCEHPQPGITPVPPAMEADHWSTRETHVSFFKIPHISDIILYLSFSVWLTSLSTTISRSILPDFWRHLSPQPLTVQLFTQQILPELLLLLRPSSVGGSRIVSTHTNDSGTLWLVSPNKPCWWELWSGGSYSARRELMRHTAGDTHTFKEPVTF